jgi:hypothetical protein
MEEETRDWGDPSLLVSERSELNNKVDHRAERAKCRGEGDGMLVKKNKEEEDILYPLG